MDKEKEKFIKILKEIREDCLKYNNRIIKV
jgi:hypothetical protein